MEGTNNGASGTGASYTYYGAGTGSWTSGGANNTTSDRDATTMWGATTIALGSQTIALNATGLTTVQNWYSGSLSNYGVTIQNQSGTTQDYLVFDSREGARPPLLNVTYCVGSPAIGDLVWDDTDGDGIQDAGETGHAGVTVELRKKSDDSLVATTTTNAAGLFSFSNPASDTYYLQFTAPAGYSFTLADQGSDDTLDSDAGVGGKTGDIVWTQGGTASVKWDAGLARSCTTVTSRVNASSDDAQQSGTTMSLTGSTLPISSSSLLWGARFQNVNVPNGATIQSAAITFRSSSAQSGSNGVRTLYGQAADNPTTFTTTASNLSGRTRTTASVIWNIASIYANTNFQSYLITNIVQEIVNRAGWAANNAMVILGPTTGTNTRTATSYDGSSTYAPLLTVTYCAANPVPTITTVGTLTAFNERGRHALGRAKLHGCRHEPDRPDRDHPPDRLRDFHHLRQRVGIRSEHNLAAPGWWWNCCFNADLRAPEPGQRDGLHRQYHAHQHRRNPKGCGGHRFVRPGDHGHQLDDRVQYRGGSLCGGTIIHGLRDQPDRQPCHRGAGRFRDLHHRRR